MVSFIREGPSVQQGLYKCYQIQRELLGTSKEQRPPFFGSLTMSTAKAVSPTMYSLREGRYPQDTVLGSKTARVSPM